MTDKAQPLSVRHPPALQVLSCWRQHILSLQPLELLQTYGVPGLLFTGGTLLGKLCRYGYLTDLNMQLEVRAQGSAACNLGISPGRLRCSVCSI